MRLRLRPREGLAGVTDVLTHTLRGVGGQACGCLRLGEQLAQRVQAVELPKKSAPDRGCVMDAPSALLSR